MTESAVVYTDHPDSNDAGRVLGMQIAEAIHGSPDVVILFAAPTYDQVTLLETLKRTCRPSLLVGCSSAGEFTNRVRGEGMVSAVALRSEEMLFSLGVGRGVSKNRNEAAKSLVSAFRGTHSHDFKYHSAVVLVDALAGHTDDLIEQMTVLTQGSYQFLGGGAGDNAQFSHTPVFYGTEVLSDAVVALEILSNKPVGIGAQHGWRPASASMLVTGAKDMCLDSIKSLSSACRGDGANVQYRRPSLLLPTQCHWYRRRRRLQATCAARRCRKRLYSLRGRGARTLKYTHYAYHFRVVGRGCDSSNKFRPTKAVRW